MAGERKYTRIPPESTGDRVYMIHTAEIPYDNKDTNHVWQIGARYYLTGASNSNNDFSIHVHGVHESTSTTGTLDVHYEKGAKIEGYTPENNQSIRKDSNSGDIVATINGAAYDVYIPAQNIMGWDNPEYGWNIDRFGSGNVRFSEGPAQISAYGSLRTTESTLLAQYAFDKSILSQEFANTLVGTGSISHDASRGYVVESVGTETNALATHTSNTYHPHIPGASNLFIIGNKLGDSGVQGLVRNWGCFDASEGFMFRLNGTSLQVVHRRVFALGDYGDAGDSPQDGISEGVIPQSMWNRDRLDGTGSSGMILDVTKPNNYWIDYQNLGGGTIRWGVFYNGERIVCHEMDMGNGGAATVWTTNAIRNPNRPICWSMKRIDGSQGDVSTRYQYPLGASAFIEGIKVDIMSEADVRGYDDSFTITENTPRTQGAYYFVSIRPKISVLSSDGVTLIDNHSLYQPTGLNMVVKNETNTLLPGELRIFSRCLLKNENWKDVSFSNLQIEEDGFHEGHGPEIFRKAFDGFCNIDWTNIFKTIQNGSIKPNSEKNTARRKQNLANVSDRNGFVYIAVKNNPDGSNTHIFEDRGEVAFSGLTVDGPANLNGNTYYLSIDSSDDAYIYSNTTDFDDDRTSRVLTYSSLVNTLSIGDTITLGSNTCVITAFNATQIRVHNRSGNIDSYAGAASTNSSPSATFNVDSVSLANTLADDDDFDYLWPKDHYTVLKALTWATVGGANTSEANTGTIEGQPPKTPVWTFMWTPFTDPVGSTEHKINFNLNWKERLQ